MVLKVKALWKGTLRYNLILGGGGMLVEPRLEAVHSVGERVYVQFQAGRPTCLPSHFRGGGAEQAESLCRRSFQLELVGGLLARAWKCLDHSVLGFLVVW